MDARTLLRTDDTYGNAAVDYKTTAELCEAAKLADHALVVVPGFIASSHKGATTTLGRSGSDYTATILGAVLCASKVVIWTDGTCGGNLFSSSFSSFCSRPARSVWCI